MIAKGGRLARLVAAAALAALAIAGVVTIGRTAASGAVTTSGTQLVNNGTFTQQTVRYDTAGKRIDAHDGHVYFFAGRYYWYGTAYGCGFDFNVPDSHFCGVALYDSVDLVHWHADGLALDPTADRGGWDAHCGGATYGCYRPKVAYDAATHDYVMWVNESRGDLGGGYLVLSSATPTGPFTLVGHRTMTYNRCRGGALAVFGDEDLFVDVSGAAYLAYTAIYHDGCSPTNATGLPSHVLAVERLNSAYTAGTGQYVVFSQKRTSIESPSLFRRGSIYYLMYSDPSCPYCTTAGTAYATARSPLGPWTFRSNVTPSRHGGQPMSVTAVAANGTTRYLYSVDRWSQNGTSRAITNQTTANYFFAPLSFTVDGRIEPVPAVTAWQLRPEDRAPGVLLPNAPRTDNAAGGYVALPAASRILDSRAAIGRLHHAHGTYSVRLPSAMRGAAAVAVNVTVVHPAGGGDVRMWGRGSEPSTSVLNYTSQRAVVANLALLLPDASGAIHIAVDGADAHLVLDVEGYYPPSAGFHASWTPQRLLDTRRTRSVPAHGAIDLSLRAGGHVTATATWVAVNVTVLAPVAGSLAAYDRAVQAAPSGGTMTLGSGVTAGLHVLRSPASGRIRLVNQTGKALNLVVDLEGYGAGTRTTMLAAPRLLASTGADIGPFTQPLAAGLSYPFSVAAAGVPASARAVVVRFAPHAATSGYLTAFADQGGVPTASVLNFASNSRPSNVAIVPLSNGIVDTYLIGPATDDLAIWVLGWIR